MHRLLLELESGRRQFASTATMVITPTRAHPTVTMALNISQAEFSSAPGRGSMVGAGADSSMSAGSKVGAGLMVGAGLKADAGLKVAAGSWRDAVRSVAVDSSAVAAEFTVEADSVAARSTAAVGSMEVADPMEVGVGKN